MRPWRHSLTLIAHLEFDFSRIARYVDAGPSVCQTLSTSFLCPLGLSCSASDCIKSMLMLTHVPAARGHQLFPFVALVLPQTCDDTAHGSPEAEVTIGILNAMPPSGPGALG